MTFEEESAGLRPELTAHAYRMLGSWDEAEDAVQETYLRGHRSWDGFEGRSSVRTWLYRIATNVCLDLARDRGRRALPYGHVDALPTERWVQPFPGDRDDLRLALVAGMQALPPAQRAVLLLRDVLQLPADEVASILGTTVPAVKSSLQRARARLVRIAPTPHDVVEPSSPEARRLLDVYVQAFETADVGLLTAVLRADATLALVPDGAWFDGKVACAGVLADAVGTPGDWVMRPTVANGAPAVVVRLRGEPFGVAVLDVRRDGIAGITVFADAALVERLEVRSRRSLM
ncbi:RNA polymerase subunit sigma-70 [Cellulomonas sp.]|uniref:RNA polymerase subunit sigma-70 n=1 Tax=Cellulomonas sp. TaxID=40001 RepID=UPI001B16826C|nr:RNA polymerase subunit sigma-70 [Cellulomonas sp.]MBO9555998.1 RNA polymerase subunit sigma-70 [Cellulomonas sp.]